MPLLDSDSRDDRKQGQREGLVVNTVCILTREMFCSELPPGIWCPSSTVKSASMQIKGPLLPEGDLRVCQGPDEKEGQD